MLRAAWTNETFQEFVYLLTVCNSYSHLNLFVEHEQIGQKLLIVQRLPRTESHQQVESALARHLGLALREVALALFIFAWRCERGS